MQSVRLDKLTFSWDPADPDGFRAGQARIGAELGARRTGTTVYELPPGQAVCPYHFEYGEEEWLLVLDGRPSVRTPDGTRQLEPRELMFFPTGPAGAHQVRNDSDAPALVVMWSEVVSPTATAYPDSEKVGVYVRDENGLVFRRASTVGYFDGEPGAQA
ncbi:MAG: cupin domain-containing protein [Conexibacter sp.]